MKKKLRIFAGPNGSGKSDLYRNIEKLKIHFGYYVNADGIESALHKVRKFSFNQFRIKITRKDFDCAINETTLLSDSEKIKIKRNYLLQANSISFYGNFHPRIPALIADLVRNKLLERGSYFTFETVMSHPGKVEFIRKAKAAGYKIYFYFVATNNPLINISRVKNRVVKGGHDVDEGKIIDRYYKSLQYLFDAVLLTDRAYLFDNSGTEHKLIAEITKGKEVEIKVNENEIPDWFINYFYLKAIK